MDGKRQSGRVIIVGGGIGGLTAALCLHRAGVAVEVYESVQEVRPLGVGINLQPSAVRVLHELGLEPALASSAIETAELVYVNRYGQRIWQEPRGRAAGYAVPQYSVHRGELQVILHRAAVATLPEGAVRTGHVFERLEVTGDGVHAWFRDRASGALVTTRGDALVGADGIHSAVRRLYYPDEGPPRFAGRMLWRATTEAPPFLTGRSMVWAGHDRQKFVCYPISEPLRRQGRALLNWIAELQVPEDTVPPRTDWNRRVDKAVFEAPFQTWDFGWLNVPRLIAEAEAVYEFPMVDRDPLPRWTHGRVTLLGDAAHPMVPVGSNGASQAILDALELADRWQAGGDAEAALAAYEAVRRPATAAVVLANRQGGPDRVLQLAEERSPEGFRDIEDVIPRWELEEIASRYKQTAGFDRDTVNRKVAARGAPGG
jgi:2-polyprenyl-6-methoxyphenol hydroxylase-like FAD-dependent oxidoreductase